MKISEKFNWQVLCPEDGHYFFGYYDRDPWNADLSKHLTLKAPQCEKLPQIGETAEVGYLEGTNRPFVPCAKTRAWCHQQGAMTLWLKHRQNCFIYNDFDLEEQKLVARIYEIGRGVVGRYEFPIYAMSPDGRWGATLNFARIPRRGYTYAEALLPDDKVPDLDQDGVFLIDMHTGTSTLLVNYRQLIAAHPMAYDLKDQYLWLNHIIFNCDSSKLLFLFRHCPEQRKPHWQTNMYTVDINGSDLACTLSQLHWTNGMISHQIWGRTPNEILIDANWRQQGNEYVVFDDRIRPFRATRISRGMGPMAHLIFSPDGKWLLADSYPKDGFQSLARVNAENGEIEIIGRFRHQQPDTFPVDVRCDLHPRWSADGKRITVDSIHQGKRKVYLLNIE
ncbi:MAG: hypothetical protein WCT05_01085 [Lentisphaeria bacterium]